MQLSSDTFLTTRSALHRRSGEALPSWVSVTGLGRARTGRHLCLCPVCACSRERNSLNNVVTYSHT